MALVSAALKEASLVVAVCLLLHSSLGQGQSPPPPAASPDCPYTGQQQPPPTSPPPVVPAAPTPTPMPTPAAAPMPPTPMAPAPAPVNNCSYNDCASQCDQSCRATGAAGIASCQQSDHAAAFSACYDSCTSHSGCPGKSCAVHNSGCGLGDCRSCRSRSAGSCCESCGDAVSSGPDPEYTRCKSYWERSVAYCVIGCQDSCSKNCAH